MARFLGNVSTPLTYKVNSQSALDPRVVVDTKEELTKAETWPQSGESVYVYDGQIVYVKSEQCAYALVDKNNYTNVNSWKYVGGYEDIYAYDIKLEAIQDTSKIVAGKLTFDMISNTTTVSGIYYDENNNYFYRTVQIGGATGAVETQYYLTWGDLGDNIVTSEELGEVKDGKTYPKANTTYYCEYQDADGKQDFTIPLDFNGFVPGKLYISVLNGKMYKASSSNSLITVSGGDSSYLLNRLIALEKAGAEDDVLEFNEMVNTKDIVEPSVAANNYTIAFDTHNKQFVAYENGVYYANWKENDFNKPSAAYGEKMYSGIKPTAGKIYIDISTNQIYRWNGVDLIALNATADSIKIGKNDDGNTYKIALNSDGSGHLANKGIEWNAEGDVTFGQNVTLNWSNIENPPTPPAGEGTFKSTVFTRNNATPDTPTGGSYNNPKPDGNIWSDGIPDGDEILWASTRVFSTLGEDSELEQKAWTDPKKMTDTASFNVEFSKLETPKAPTDFKDGETEEQWRAKNQDWENEAFENTIWMATNTRKNGVWGGWQVSKIKGEKGDNGTSISIKKGAKIVPSKDDLSAISNPVEGDICFVGSIEDMDAVVSYVYQENDWVAQTGIQLGDSYLVDEWLFMWDGDSWIKSQFKGDPGKSSYIHIKYANSSNPGDWTGRGEEAGAPIIPDDKTSWGETPGAYMGVYSDNIETDSKNWKSYKWTKWEGQDGMGYEYVYRTTPTNKAPELSENEYTKNEITYNPSNDGFIPENWSDDPISISSETPFCWMAVRQKLDGKWSSFKISLWSKWGSDSIKLDLDNDNDSIMYRDDTPISTVVSKATLYDGIYPVTDNIEYSVADWGTAEGELVNNQITITNISSPSTSVKIRAEYKENEYFATLSIKKLVNADKYEIICTPNAIPHNIDKGVGKTTQHVISVDTYKTSFETGKRELLTELPDGYTLICNINDNNNGNDDVAISNGKYTLDITDSNKPDSLTFTLNKSIKEKEETITEVLDSETIPVNYVEDGRGVSEIVTHFAISDSDKVADVEDNEVNGEIISKVDWYISAPAVTPNKPFLWQRTKTIYTKGDPTGWSYNMVGRMGENGISPNAAFKSTVFTRTNVADGPGIPDPDVTEINGIKYNTYDNPIPGSVNGKNELIWSDGIPSGDAVLWASTRIFSNDGQSPQQAEWTKPKKMTDTSDFDVAFSRQITLDPEHSKPKSHGDHNDEQTDASGVPYWENTSDEKTVWMATSTCKNGVWDDWKVSKIKGEKGEDGQSIKVTGHYKDLAAFEAEWKENGEWKAPSNTSDCYVVGTNLYVWDGDSWEDVGPFKGDKGEKGDTYILYVRYSASPDGSDMSTVPNKYIGVASSKETTAPTSPSDYTWSKWRGEDGFGYEYIYKATVSAGDSSPKLPVVTNFENDVDFQKDGFIPNGWSDDPIDVSEELRYCWTCYRQKVDGVWQQFRGSKKEDGTETGYASLWSHWAIDGAPGVGIVSMTRRYLITAAYTGENGKDITIEKIKELYGPTKENPINAAWQLNSPTVTPERPLLVEWIHTVYTSGAEDDDYAIAGRMGAPGLDGSLIEYIYILTETIDKTISVPEENSPSINTNELGKWTDDPQSVSKEYPYQWISEREFDRTQNKWGNYSKPVLWSIWSKGENSVHLDLDNEMDSFLYDGNGNLLSNIITTTPTLYDGLNPVTEGIKWEVSAPDSEKNTNEDTFYSFDDKSGILTVNKMSAAENTVVYSITATYKDAKYVSSLTIKKLVGVDKYDLVVTPNSITYNTSIGDESASTKSVNIQVYRTSQGEGRKLITNLNSYKPIEIHVDGTDISAEYLEDGYTFTPDYTKSSIEIDLIKDGIVVDTETIPINKSKDGDNGAAGANAIRLDLDNENDSMLYDGSNNCISGNVISNVSLYDGSVKVSNNNIKWYLSNSNGINISNSSAVSRDGYIESNTPITGPNGTYKIVNAGSYFNWDGTNYSIKICGYVYKNNVPWSNFQVYFNDDKSVINNNIGANGSVEKDKNQATTNSDGYFEYVVDNDFISKYRLTALANSQLIGAYIYPESGEANIYPYMRVYRSESANGKNDAWITTDGKVTVTGVTETSNYVQIKGEYPIDSNKYYYTNLSIKKLVGIDKYDLAITPNSIAYNTSTKELSSNTINIGVYRTSQSEGRKLVTDLGDLTLEINNPNVTNPDATDAYNLRNKNNTTDTSKFNISITSYIPKASDIGIVLKDSNGVVLDIETIPINKSENGSNIKLDFDNENDYIIYNELGEKKSNSVSSTATLYKNGVAIEPEKGTDKKYLYKWIPINVDASEPTFNNGKCTITIHGVSSMDGGSVKLGLSHEGSYHYATFSVKKLINEDKYEIKTNPSSIVEKENETGGETVKISIFKTNQNGLREPVSELPDNKDNKYCLYYIHYNGAEAKTYGKIDYNTATNSWSYSYDSSKIKGTHIEFTILHNDNIKDGGTVADTTSNYLDKETVYIGRVKDGDKGENAITYEIVPDISYFTKAADNSSASGRIGGFVYKIDGNSRTRIKSDTLVQYPWGNVASGKLYIAAGYCDDNGNFSFIHNPLVDSGKEDASKNGRFDTSAYFTDMVMDKLPADDNRRGLIVSNSITLELRDSNNAVLASFNVSAAKNGMAGDAGKQSAPLRVSEWSAGTTYYSGYEENAPWSDTVIYKDSASNTKQYYRCMKFHIAKDENAPGTNTTYWNPAEEFSFIATNLLLAERARIDNLVAGIIQTAERGPRLVAEGNDVFFYGAGMYPRISLGIDDNGQTALMFHDEADGKIIAAITPDGIKRWEEASIGESVYENKDYRIIADVTSSSSGPLQILNWKDYYGDIFFGNAKASSLWRYTAGRDAYNKISVNQNFAVNKTYAEASDGKYHSFKPSAERQIGVGDNLPFTGLVVRVGSESTIYNLMTTNLPSGEIIKHLPKDYLDRETEYIGHYAVDWSTGRGSALINPVIQVEITPFINGVPGGPYCVYKNQNQN